MLKSNVERFAIFVDYLDEREVSNVTSYMASACQPVLYLQFVFISFALFFGFHGCLV